MAFEVHYRATEENVKRFAYYQQRHEQKKHEEIKRVVQNYNMNFGQLYYLYYCSRSIAMATPMPPPTQRKATLIFYRRVVRGHGTTIRVPEAPIDGRVQLRHRMQFYFSVEFSSL